MLDSEKATISLASGLEIKGFQNDTSIPFTPEVVWLRTTQIVDSSQVFFSTSSGSKNPGFR